MHHATLAPNVATLAVVISTVWEILHFLVPTIRALRAVFNQKCSLGVARQVWSFAWLGFVKMPISESCGKFLGSPKTEIAGHLIRGYHFLLILGYLAGALITLALPYL